MRRSEVQELLRAERNDLAVLLAGLSPEQWDAPTPCVGWTVEAVAAHLASAVGLTRSGLFGRFLRYGSGTDAANARAVTAWTRKGRGRIVEDIADPNRLGLGYFYPTWALCETVVHHQDIRHGLQLHRDIAPARLRIALDVLVRYPMITGARRRTRRVHLNATDMDWEFAKGKPDVHGTAEAILMALAGRRSVSGDAIWGPGRDTR